MLSIHRYPQFFVDIVVARIMFARLRWLSDFRIGAGARVRGLPIVVLAPGSAIHIGRNAYVISRSRNTALGVNHPVVIRTLRSGSRIFIGEHCRVSGVTLCAANSIQIGDRVTMGANATVVDTDFHSIDPTVRSSGPGGDDTGKTGPVRIGNDVFVGMNATILKGVSIGDGAVIGAGAVVTRDVPAGGIVGGNPARILTHLPQG
jgi:acetyltransferase-like isoleucine patch superfamily enzyme